MGAPRQLFTTIKRLFGRTSLTQAEVDAINAALLATDIDPAHRNISSAGLALIKRSEGLKLKAYRDVAGVWTIGYGHTGPDVKAGLVITEAQADALLRLDLASAEQAAMRLAPSATQGQFDALVSFIYNLGEGRLARSTLLKRHNAGDFAGAAGEFSKWVYADGRKYPGLVNRRAEEAALYLGRAA